MKRSKTQLLRSLAAVMLLGAGLASCSQDDFADKQDTLLPEGVYPLEIASVTLDVESNEEPWGVQTRVTENSEGNRSIWQAGDKINVQIGNGNTGTYELNADGSVNTNNSQPAYWSSTADNQTITAWYTTPDYTNENTVTISDQSSKLAYVLQAKRSANYNKPVSLTFSHALAKVRVELQAGTADVRKIEVKGYTACTNTGDKASELGWITMYRTGYNNGSVYYEAHVVAGTLSKTEAFRITSSNNSSATLNLDADVTLTKKKIHLLKLTVNKKGTETIFLSAQGDTYTVESDKSVIIDGGGSFLNKRIIIKEGASVVLQNVKLNAPTTQNNTIEVQGNATISLSGTNEINGSNNNNNNKCCPMIVTSGTLTINGTHSANLKLTSGTGGGGALGLTNNVNLVINGGNIEADASAADNGAGIGTAYTVFNGYQSGKAGNITINGGMIKAKGGPNSAGIGASRQSGCGNITITGGHITAEAFQNGSNQAAGIGAGGMKDSSCGNITISGQSTVVSAKSYGIADDIGRGFVQEWSGGIAMSNCGTVNIIAGAIVNNNIYQQNQSGYVKTH